MAITPQNADTMNDITKQDEMSLPQKIRSEHEPQVGDVYQSNSMSYEIFVRIKRIETYKSESGQEYKRFYFEEYDMYSREWRESRWGEDYYIGADSLKSYSYVIFDFEEMLRQFDEIDSGNVSFDDMAPIESTALVAKGKSDLLAMKEQQEMTIAKVSYMKDMLEAKAKDYKRAMERKMEPLKNAIAVMRKTVENMNYAIKVIEGYLGVGVEAITITDGERAETGSAVTVRQRILFMDEEVACIMADGQGLDHYGKDVFYEWMKEPKNRDIIVPEKRCIVIMKPKRYDHYYSDDFYDNRAMNRWNHHSFIVIRDGDNVLCIESGNLCVFDKVFTKPDECKTESMEAQIKRTIYLCAVLQGLVEQGVLFGGDPNINIIKGHNVNLVYDDDDNMIGTGIMPFNDFVKEKNKGIKRGSRIVYYGGGEPTKYYASKWNMPDSPKCGVYSVEVNEQGKHYFLYMPTEKAYSWTEGYTERKKRIGWTLGNYINYDAVTSAEIEAYFRDRTQRKHYVKIIPLLSNLKMAKADEESWERDFSKLMAAQFKDYDETRVMALINEAIVWWREKVIYIRPLKSDDKKSWRMIKSFIEKRLSHETNPQ